jgi:hypothetical protein
MTAEVFYVKDVLGAGDAAYALLTAVWMLGMVLGATTLPARVPPKLMAGVALVALGVQGAGVAGQTAWAVLPVALVGYAIGGVGHGLKNTLIRTVVAARVPRALHGRAFAAYNAARNAAELGALGAGGVLVSAVGAREALLVAGLGPVIAAVGGLVALRRSAGTRPPAYGWAGVSPVPSAPSAARSPGGISTGRRLARSTNTCTNHPVAAGSGAPSGRSTIS